MNFSKDQLRLLSEFVSLLKANPKIIHAPELKFFKDWLISLDAKIDTQGSSTKSHSPPKHEKEENVHSPSPTVSEPEESSEEEPEIIESDIEIDREGTIVDDEIPNQEMGSIRDDDTELSDDQLELIDAKRSEAMHEMSEGNFESAIAAFTECIKHDSNSAPLFAKRANCFLKLKRPNACIKDALRAIELNPDSSQAYKCLGLAHKLLGNWDQSFAALSTSNKIDFSEDTLSALKEVEPKAKKLNEHHRRHERKVQEREVRLRQNRVKKARQAYEKAKKSSSGPSRHSGSAPGGFSPQDLFSDPELMSMMQDPEVMSALNEIMTDQSKMAKYANNPKIKKVIEKMQSSFMGGVGGGMFGAPGGGMFGGASGMPGGHEGTHNSADDLD